MVNIFSNLKQEDLYSKNPRCPIPRIGLEMSILASKILLWKRALQICIYTYIHLHEDLFCKTSFKIRYWHCKIDFWIDAYHVVEKSSSFG